MKTSTLVYLITGLCLAVLPACGGPTDPSQDDNKKDNNGTSMDMGGGGGGMDQGSNPPADQGTDPADQGTDPADQGTDPADQGTDPGDEGTPLGECEQRALYEGQMGNPNPKKGGGGSFVLGTDSYEADSGLIKVNEQVKAALDAGTITEDDQDTMDVLEDQLVFNDGEEIVVTGAIVTSTAFERDDGANFTLATRLTFQDQQVGVLAFIDGITMDKNGMPIVVKVGDKLNFKVKSVRGFGGDTPQISEVIEVEKVGAGEDVGVMEKTGEDLVVEDYQKLVRIHGTIESTEGTPCGGSNSCYDLKHGDKTVTLRINDAVSRAPMMGDCVTYVGPVGSFPGPLADSPMMQVDAVNFTWYRGPFAE